jgi:glycogen synthase
MPNYLHLNPRYYPYIGGSELYMQVLAERFAQEPDTQVSVFATDAWDLEHFWSSGKRTVPTRHEVHNRVCITRFPVRRLPIVSPLFYPVMRRGMAILSSLPTPDGLIVPLLNQLGRTTPLVPSLWSGLKNRDFDLIHTANAPFDSLIYEAWRYSRKRNAAFVLTPFVHLGEPKNPQIRKYYTMRHQINWLKQADAVLTMTSLERDYLLSRGVPEAKMHIVGVGVNPAEVTGGNAGRFRAKHDLQNERIVFYQGTAAFDKGTIHLVQAMQKLWREGLPDTVLVIAGPKMSHFDRFYADLPDEAKKRIKVLGFIEPEEKQDLFAAGNVFAMPSRTDSFGIVYMEAWLNNIPVIGANAGGVPALVEHEKDGLIIEFGDVPALANAIKFLLSDKTLADKLAGHGRQKVLEKYTWDKVYGQIKQIYHAVLHR